MLTVDSSPDSCANIEVPSSSELHNTSQDILVNPKLEASSDDDICSKTLVDETPSSVDDTGDDVSDVKPVSPSCAAEAVGDGVSDVKPVSPAAEVVAIGEQLDDVADDQFLSASEGESLPLLLYCIMLYIRYMNDQLGHIYFRL